MNWFIIIALLIGNKFGPSLSVLSPSSEKGTKEKEANLKFSAKSSAHANVLDILSKISTYFFAAMSEEMPNFDALEANYFISRSSTGDCFDFNEPAAHMLLSFLLVKANKKTIWQMKEENYSAILCCEGSLLTARQVDAMAISKMRSVSSEPFDEKFWPGEEGLRFLVRHARFAFDRIVKSTLSRRPHSRSAADAISYHGHTFVSKNTILVYRRKEKDLVPMVAHTFNNLSSRPLVSIETIFCQCLGQIVAGCKCNFNLNRCTALCTVGHNPPAPADPSPLIVAEVDAPLLVPPAAAVEAPAPDVALLALGAVGGSGGGGGSRSSRGRGRRGKGGRGTHTRAAEIGSGMQSLDPRDLERAEAEFVQFCGSFFVLGKLPLTSWLESVLGVASPCLLHASKIAHIFSVACWESLVAKRPSLDDLVRFIGMSSAHAQIVVDRLPPVDEPMAARVKEGDDDGEGDGEGEGEGKEGDDVVDEDDLDVEGLRRASDPDAAVELNGEGLQEDENPEEAVSDTDDESDEPDGEDASTTDMDFDDA